MQSRRAADTLDKVRPGELRRYAAIALLVHLFVEQQPPAAVRPSNRTTDFDFSYTFTTADAVIGKVTFAASATILGTRDALDADNQGIATTKVNGQANPKSTSTPAGGNTPTPTLRSASTPTPARTPTSTPTPAGG